MAFLEPLFIRLRRRILFNDMSAVSDGAKKADTISSTNIVISNGQKCPTSWSFVIYILSVKPAGYYVFPYRFRDTLCGTKMIRKRDYEIIAANRSYFGDFDPFGDFDLIFGAVKQNLKVIEVPVGYRARTYGETNISRFRHGWLLLKMSWIAFKKIKWLGKES